MTAIDVGRYYDAGPLVVRVIDAAVDSVTFSPVQAGGKTIDDADTVQTNRDDFSSRFRRL